jgi:protein-tyrosine phosphatase
MAEGAFRLITSRAGFSVSIDSARIGGWHVGDPPDRRAQSVAKRNGIDISRLRARQIGNEDFARYDHILAMDLSNLKALREIRPSGSAARVALLMDHVPGCARQEVPDPFYGRNADFESVWEDVLRGAEGLLAWLRDQA